MHKKLNKRQPKDKSSLQRKTKLHVPNNVLANHRPDSTAQNNRQTLANNSSKINQLKAIQDMANNSQVLQQKRGRVRPTAQLKRKVNINDNAGLEREADVMGAKAVAHHSITQHSRPPLQRASNASATEVIQGFWKELALGAAAVTGAAVGGLAGAAVASSYALAHAGTYAAVGGGALLGGLIGGGATKKAFDHHEQKKVVFYVNKPNAAKDPAWVKEYNTIKGMAAGDKGFQFNDSAKSIKIKYNFIQLAELFPKDLRSTLWYMIPKALRAGVQEKDVYKIFGTPHFIKTYDTKEKALLAGSKKEVNDYDFSDFDKKFSGKKLKKLKADIKKKKPGKQIELLLKTKDFSGMVIGESHTDPAAKEFIMEKMASLKKHKVNTIYLEHIRSEYQELLDSWFSKPIGTPMPANLKKLLDSNDVSNGIKDRTHNLAKLVQKAHDNRIRIVGIDSLHAQYQPDAGGGAEQRDMVMNTFAHQTIKGDQSKRKGGKFVALVGGAHANTHAAKALGGAGYAKGLPGLSQQLFVPALEIDPAKNKLVLDREDKGKRILV